MIENSGQLNELDHGEKMGLYDDETRGIIVQLLFEHKIEYAKNRACNYSQNENSETEK